MARSYTTDDLVTNVKRRSSFPAFQNTFPPSDVIAMANDEMQDTLVPKIKSVREEYFVTKQDIAINSTGIYPMPASTVAETLRYVWIVDPGGNVRGVPRLEPERLTQFTYLGTGYVGSAGFYLEGNNVILVPAGGSGSSVRLGFEKRPNDLIVTSSCAQITSIGIDGITGGTSLAFSGSLPSTFTVGAGVDVIGSVQPFATVTENAIMATAAAGAVGFALPALSGPAVGQWVCPNTQSCVIQLPAMAFSLLCQLTAMKISEAQTDSEAYSLMSQRYLRMEDDFIKTISPRVEGVNKKFTGRRSLFFGWR